jgi:response regulator RpfG family c-di-GMP phosphodiesterase
MPIETARSIIAEGSGTHFDPDIVKAFMAIKPEQLSQYMEVGKTPSA